MGRRAQIVRLLDVRFEGFPDVHRRFFGASTGFVHRTRAPQVCPVCEGVESFGCAGCGGRGEVEVLRERDPYAVDKIQPYGITPDRREAEAARDRQIVALGRQTRPARDVDEAAEADRDPWPWERARARLYRDYHLKALDLALEQLHLSWPGLSAYSNAGLDFLDARLPDPLRAPAAPSPVVSPPPNGRAAGGAALSRRDAAIRSAIDGGAPTAHVSASFGLSISQVNKIAGKAA
jgi:hypothetical protein